MIRNAAYILGWMLASGGLLAQVVRVYLTRSARDISLAFGALYVAGYLVMLLRSWGSGYWVWWAAHLVAIGLGAALLAGKLAYG